VNLPKPYYQDDVVTLYNADARQIVPFVSGLVEAEPHCEPPRI